MYAEQSCELGSTVLNASGPSNSCPREDLQAEVTHRIRHGMWGRARGRDQQTYKLQAGLWVE